LRQPIPLLLYKHPSVRFKRVKNGFYRMYVHRAESPCHTNPLYGPSQCILQVHAVKSRTPGATRQSWKETPPQPYAKDQMSHLCQVYTSRASLLLQRSIAIVVVTLFLRRLGELLLPSCVRLRSVDVGEDEVEDLGVPRDGFAFDAFFDILQRKDVSVCSTVFANLMGILTSGNSSQSLMQSLGKMIIVAPARRAATVFSRRPPMRRTLPVTVSSPVIAMVGFKG
jgi:hypothetical protein